MNQKQLEKWKEIYANMLAITSLQPWNYIGEDTPLIYKRKDNEEPIIFNIWGQSADVCGVAAYFSLHDYLCGQMRMKSRNLKEEPVFFMQNMVLALWGDREMVEKENKALIKELGLRFRGKGGWLYFESFKERCKPQFLTDKETDELADALGNLHLMLKAALQGDLETDFDNGETVVRFCGENGTWYNAKYSAKEVVDLSVISPLTLVGESESLKWLSELPTGNLVIELDERCIPIPICDRNTKVTYFPLLIIAADSKSGAVLQTKDLAYDEEREDALYEIISELSDKYGKIKQIKINDEFTKASLDDFCKKSGIKLNYQQKPLKQINKFFQDLASELFDEDRDELAYAFEDEFDDEFVDESAPRKKAKNINIGKAAAKTFVFSVSVGTGCYRHIKISGASTLEDLHCEILNAFEFDNDHAHAFFLDNKAWSSDAYYSRYIEGSCRSTCDYTLSQVLEEKQKFLYIFDFGDEWRFQCRVLRITDESCDTPEIVRSVGEPPEQYPVYDEDDYDKQHCEQNCRYS